MSAPVRMPKLGNTVESCILLNWHKQIGDRVEEGELLCEVETDKAIVEVVSPAAGVLLETFYDAGDEISVLTNIAVLGEPGEDTSRFDPQGTNGEIEVKSGELPIAGTPQSMAPPAKDALSDSDRHAVTNRTAAGHGKTLISSRARNMAADKGVDIASLKGSGPGGRIIERDVSAALERKKPISPLAQSMLERDEFEIPLEGSGIRGRIMSRDLRSLKPTPEAIVDIHADDEAVRAITISGVRKLIAERLLISLQSTAQLTLSASADARVMLSYRERVKGSTEDLGLVQFTVNDLILFVVSRTLVCFPEINALFEGDTIYEYETVHLGMAVDTPRGLIVPVIREANALNLSQIVAEARRSSVACLEGKITPDELTGGTFTVTNLGNLGIESFTPILNPPQVGILGIGNVNLKPVEVDGEVDFIPCLGLSLTVNHQAVDGAPAARFLQALSAGIADVESLLEIELIGKAP